VSRNCRWLVELDQFPLKIVGAKTRKFDFGAEKSPKQNLHYQRKAFELAFQNGQRTTRHFDPARGVDRSRLRNTVASTRQKNLQQFRCFAGINHATLDQVVSQGAQLRHRKSFFGSHSHLSTSLPLLG
jgi:hypothetical protein